MQIDKNKKNTRVGNYEITGICPSAVPKTELAVCLISKLQNKAKIVNLKFTLSSKKEIIWKISFFY